MVRLMKDCLHLQETSEHQRSVKNGACCSSPLDVNTGSLIPQLGIAQSSTPKKDLVMVSLVQTILT